MENYTNWNMTLQGNLTLLPNTNESNGAIHRFHMTKPCLVYSIFMSVGVSGAFTVFGLVGNALSSMVLLQQKKSALNASMNFLLVILSLLDSFMLLSLFTLKTIPSFCQLGYWPEYLRFYYSYLLTYLWPVSTSVVAVNEYVVVLISLHRYLYVCHNKLARKCCTLRLTRIQTALIFVFGFVYSLPRYLEFKLVYVPGAGRKVRTMTTLMENKAYRLWYNAVSFYLVIYIIPLVLLITLTTQLIKVVKKARKKRAQLVSSEAAFSSRKNDEDVTICLVAVVCVFCFTQIHNPIRRTIEFLGVPYSCSNFLFYYVEINTLLNVVNYSVNFLLYFMFNKRFRGKLRQLMCKRGAVVPVTSFTVSGTSNMTHTAELTNRTFVPRHARVNTVENLTSNAS